MQIRQERKSPSLGCQGLEEVNIEKKGGKSDRSSSSGLTFVEKSKIHDSICGCGP